MPEYTEEQLYAMTPDELRKLAEEEARQQAAAPAPEQKEEQQQAAEPSQPRDEKGRFTKPQEEQQQQEASDDKEDEQEQYVYRKTIDWGDGQVDVYEADTMDELIDKIAEGKKNANLKIRDQEKELKDLRAKQPVPAKQYTEDEEYVLSQEMLSKPTEAMRKMFKDMTGYDIENFRTVADKVTAWDEANAKNTAINSFYATHLDYRDTPRNTKWMQTAMSGKPVTVENLHKAYLEGKQEGLLEFPGEEAHVNADEKTKETEPTVQPRVETTQTRTKRSSGVSTHTRPAPAPKSNEPSEDDLYDSSKYSLDDVKRLAAQQLAQRNRQ